MAECRPRWNSSRFREEPPTIWRNHRVKLGGLSAWTDAAVSESTHQLIGREPHVDAFVRCRRAPSREGEMKTGRRIQGAKVFRRSDWRRDKGEQHRSDGLAMRREASGDKRAAALHE